MEQKRIGALTIGQSPRPDLVAPLETLLPDWEIIQAGALDDLVVEDLPEIPQAAYPLSTQMRSGAAVIVDESFISPKLQGTLDRLEEQGIIATLLLCAGTFENLHGEKPIYKPFDICCNVLGALNMENIGIIVPVKEQEQPIKTRWKSKGWKPTVWTADIMDQDQEFQQKLMEMIRIKKLECIILDYVGHPVELVTHLKNSIAIPVIDLGYLAMVTIAAMI